MGGYISLSVKADSSYHNSGKSNKKEGISMEKLYSAAPYFYGASKDAPNTYRICVEMQDEVDEAILRHAVQKAKDRYPYFCVKVVRKNQELMLEENNEEFVISQDDKNVVLGGTASNGHLLAFSYEKDRICFDCFHGLADSAGLHPLVRTVIYYYCQEKYDAALDPKGIHLAGENIPAEEIEEPFPEKVDENIKPAGRAERKQALCLAEESLCARGTPVQFLLCIPESIFMKYSKSNDGSPATVLTLLLARAIDELHKDAAKPVIGGVVMNIRSGLGKPFAHHSLISQIFLEYKDRMKSMDTGTQATCMRGMTMLQKQDENILSFVRENLRMINYMKTIPNIEGKQKTMKQFTSLFYNAATFKVSYVGRSSMGASEKYIKSIYTSIDLNGCGIMLEINAVNGFFDIAFMQEWQEKVYFQAFVDQLIAEEIPFEFVGKEPLKVSSIAFD